MFVTTRKNNEKIILVVEGVKIDIHFFKPQKINSELDDNKNLVSVGIEAPHEVKIYREEVWNRKQQARGTSDTRGNK